MIKKIIIVAISLLLFNCSNKKESTDNNLLGAWYFIDADSYYELHFNKSHLLLHNELTGSKISKYKVLNENTIQLIKNNLVVEEYKILELNKNHGSLIIQGRTQKIHSIEVQLNINDILKSRDDAYLNFSKRFKQRQSKYLDQISI